jgi:hypothetical protein
MSIDALHIDETERTPLIDFNPSSGAFLIKGTSIPEDTLSFYKPIFSWIDQYLKAPAIFTRLQVDLKFFNTSTSKCLFNIFSKLEEVHKKEGAKAKIEWLYKLEDTDMYESGMDFQNLVSIPFTLEMITK